MRIPKHIWSREYFDDEPEEYIPPSGGIYVHNPRQLSDFPKKLVAYYVFAAVAYSHNLSLTSLSSQYILEVLQVITFLFLPFTPIVLIFWHFLKAAMFVVQRKFRMDGVMKFTIAGACGMRSEFTRDSNGTLQPFHILDVNPNGLDAEQQPCTTLPYLARTALLVANAAVLGLSVGAYIERLKVRYHSASYVAALGLDHRMGWLAIGALATTLVSLPIQLINTRWRVRTNVNDEASKRWPELAWVALIAASIQDVLQHLTNRPLFLFVSGVLWLHRNSRRILGRFVIVYWALNLAILAFIIRKVRWRRDRIFYLLGILCVVMVPIVQLVYDIKEVLNIRDEKYEPWNYRWAVNDPPWWSL